MYIYIIFSYNQVSFIKMKIHGNVTIKYIAFLSTIDKNKLNIYDMNI